MCYAVAQPRFGPTLGGQRRSARLQATRFPQAGELCYTDKTRLLAGEAPGILRRRDSCCSPLMCSGNFVTHEGRDQFTLEGVERTMEWVENSFLLDIEDQGSLGASFRLDKQDLVAGAQLSTGLSTRLWHARRGPRHRSLAL